MKILPVALNEKMPCHIVEIMFMHGKISKGFHTLELLRKVQKKKWKWHQSLFETALKYWEQQINIKNSIIIIEICILCNILVYSMYMYITFFEFFMDPPRQNWDSDGDISILFWILLLLSLGSSTFSSSSSFFFVFKMNLWVKLSFKLFRIFIFGIFLFHFVPSLESPAIFLHVKEVQ